MLEIVNGSTYNYRNSSRKNYVPKSLIGTMTRIAYYSTGAGYMISMEALPKLLTGYRYLPFISHNEDMNVGRAMGLIGIPYSGFLSGDRKKDMRMKRSMR